MDKKKDIYKFSRAMYVLEETLNYFLAIAIGSVYLAKVSSYIGISDSITGILTAFVSLGCSFQLLSFFLAKKRSVKTLVTLGFTIGNMCAALVFFIPLFDFSIKTKTVIFITSLLAMHVIKNVFASAKTNWFMTLIDNEKRASFTANKEMISLITGMVFSYGLGFVVDYFEAKGDTRSAFVVIGIGIIVLMVGHSIALLSSREKPREIEAGGESSFGLILDVLKNKTLLKLVLISVLWNVANYMTTSFMGAYQNNELGFSMTFASAIIMVGALVRASFSRPMGMIASKSSFCNMLIVCFSVAALSFAINIFTTPQNGKVLYSLYYFIHVISLAGINSATINLIYDYAEPKERMQALAIQNTFAGLAGFLATLAVSPLVSYIQKNGNVFFGMKLYAQQVLSAMSFLVMLVLIAYMVLVIRKLKRRY